MADLLECPHCNARVVPTDVGICPACRSDIHAPTVRDVESETSSRPQQLFAPAVAVLATSVIGGCLTLVSAFGFCRFYFSQSDRPNDYTYLYLMSGTYALLLLACTVAFAGAFCMFTLRNRWLAVAGAYALVVPIFGCLLVGIPVGVWAIRAMSTPEIKNGFR